MKHKCLDGSDRAQIGGFICGKWRRVSPGGMTCDDRTFNINNYEHNYTKHDRHVTHNEDREEEATRTRYRNTLKRQETGNVTYDMENYCV